MCFLPQFVFSHFAVSPGGFRRRVREKLGAGVIPCTMTSSQCRDARNDITPVDDEEHRYTMGSALTFSPCVRIGPMTHVVFY